MGSSGAFTSVSGISNATRNVTLNAGGAVTQTQAITAGGLELLGTGPYTLTNGSNDVGTIAANTGGAISYTDANSLVVGTVNATPGVTTTGNLTLNAGGAVTQTQAIAAAGLELLGTGPYTLTNGSNDVGTIAANTGGTISYTDANNLTVGTVNATSGISTTGNGAVTLNAGGVLTLASAVGTITADGAVSLTGTGGISTAANVTTTDDDISFNSATTLTGSVVLERGRGSRRKHLLRQHADRYDRGNREPDPHCGYGRRDVYRRRWRDASRGDPDQQRNQRHGEHHHGGEPGAVRRRRPDVVEWSR